MRRIKALCVFALLQAACEPKAQPVEPAPPPAPPAPPLQVASITTGLGHSCAITAEGPAYCWGLGNEGQLGADTTITTLRPLEVRSQVRFSQISAGAEHNCAISVDGALYCWGLNDRAQLGTNDLSQRKVPTSSAFPEMRFRLVAAGGSHNCALRLDARVLCWGWNDFGQLGNNTTVGIRTPLEIVGGRSFTNVTAGAAHSCAVEAGGTAFCWGLNSSGQLGDGSLITRLGPATVAGGHSWARLSAGDRHTCGLTTAGTAYCWGAGEAGQLGHGLLTDSAVPVAVASSARFNDIAAGGEHTCAIGSSGELFCWGSNSHNRAGQAGVATIYQAPARVNADSAGIELRFASVETGKLHSCALTATQALYCWGFGGYGQLGNGTVLTRALPTRVVITAPAQATR